MTPKEKAEELFHKNYMIIHEYWEDYGEEILVSVLAIKTAVIGIESIINVLEEINKTPLLTEYWKQVKEELIKI